MENTKQLEKREKILNGDLKKVILLIVLPILFYNLCNYFYGIYDMMIVQKANIGDTADIVVLDQIKNMIQTIGGSLATGGAILVARKYGEGNISAAKKCANTLFTIALLVAGLTLLFIPLGVPLLTLLKTDKSTIDNSIWYYNVQILILVVSTINSTFIAIEKSKGNTFSLFLLNVGVIVIKIGLSTLFAFGPFSNVTITWLAVATLIAQSFMMIIGLILLFYKKNILRISFKEFNLNKVDSLMILKLTIPVFVGRFLFHFGKVYVNSVATQTYGKMCVGALGISNTMAGIMSTITNSFEDGGSTIVAQNYGAANEKRIKKFFIINFLYVVSICLVGMTILYLLKEKISVFFSPNSIEYQQMIINIFKWECLDIIFVGLGSIGTTIFYGFGKTRITMALSMATLFLFRIPTLLILIYVIKYDYTSCGIAMFVSNTLTGIIALTLGSIFIFRLNRKHLYE